MKTIVSDSWDDIIEPLLHFREIVTNTVEYDDPDSIVTILKWWMRDHDIRGYGLTAEKDHNRSSYKNPWYIIRLVPSIKNNKEGVVLLEDDY